MSGARPAPGRVSGGGPGGTPREGPNPRKRGVPVCLGGVKDRPAGLGRRRFLTDGRKGRARALMSERALRE